MVINDGRAQNMVSDLKLSVSLFQWAVIKVWKMMICMHINLWHLLIYLYQVIHWLGEGGSSCFFSSFLWNL